MDAPDPRVERHPLEALQRGAVMFTHPVARRIDWTPLHHGGPNIRNASLAETGEGRWSVRPSLQAWAFALLFVGMGAAMLARSVFDGGIGWPVAAGAALFIAGGLASITFVPRWRIDPARGRLWRRDRPFGAVHELRIADVVALQLLPEWVVAQRTRYFSYELNLVLADGERVGLMEHGAHHALLADALRLASVLQVPLWEAEAGRPPGLLNRLLSPPGRDR